MDLTGEVSCVEPYEWIETPWSIEGGYGQAQFPDRHVVCVDYGAKRNILRCLAGLGCRVTVVPARASAASILALRPNGIFLANGPGDPSATSIFAVPVIRELLASRAADLRHLPWHQLLALALGARTVKMHLVTSAATHPVQDPRIWQRPDHPLIITASSCRGSRCRRVWRRPIPRCSTGLSKVCA